MLKMYSFQQTMELSKPVESDIHPNPFTHSRVYVLETERLGKQTRKLLLSWEFLTPSREAPFKFSSLLLSLVAAAFFLSSSFPHT
jgi:hypothetical protein